MQFDGSSSYIASGAGILFTSPNGMVYPFSYHLEFPCTNCYRTVCMKGLDSLSQGLEPT
jgi:hypothetical protein